MLSLLNTRQRDFARQFASIRERGAATTAAVDRQTNRIVDAVRRRGDDAVIDFTRRFDGVRLTAANLRVSEAEIEAATRATPPAARRALRLAARRIAAFHKRQRVSSWNYSDPIGLRLGQQVTPLDTVGVYVPGGHASYP